MAGDDHLIERAAALLRGKSSTAPIRALDNAGAPGDRATTLPAIPIPTPPSFTPASLAPASLAPASLVPASLAQPDVAPAALTQPDRVITASSTATSATLMPPPDTLRPRPATTPNRAATGPLALPAISLDTLERAGMVVARTKRTRISEEYRIVVGRVMLALRNEPEGGGMHNLVLFTSALPGEGKSFSALNLAGSLAQHGTEKVLLIDLDAKQMPLSAQLGVGDRIGLRDLIINPNLRHEDVILSTAVPNLSFMPIGTRVTEAMDATGVRPIPPTIARIARRFPKHIIILDAPPCLSTSDPHTIAPYVGQVVMVVEAERTQRAEVEAAIDLVRVCPTITILLNKVKLTSSHSFGSYDYYGSYG